MPVVVNDELEKLKNKGDTKAIYVLENWKKETTINNNKRTIFQHEGNEEYEEKEFITLLGRNERI